MKWDLRHVLVSEREFDSMVALWRKLQNFFRSFCSRR
jgi:hypothetical protein